MNAKGRQAPSRFRGIHHGNEGLRWNVQHAQFVTSVFGKFVQFPNGILMTSDCGFPDRGSIGVYLENVVGAVQWANSSAPMRVPYAASRIQRFSGLATISPPDYSFKCFRIGRASNRGIIPASAVRLAGCK